MSNDMGINQVLAQIRSVAAQAQGGGMMPEAPTAVNFSTVLGEAINKVNEVQQTSASLKTAFEMGEPEVGLADVMIASEKASLSFQAMVQVRNKLLGAYQEIMSMQV